MTSRPRCLNYKECRERIFPDDPESLRVINRVEFGKIVTRSVPPLCEHCGGYTPTYETIPEPEWTRRQWDKVQQIQAEVEGWRPKHTEMERALEKAMIKKKRVKKYD